MVNQHIRNYWLGIFWCGPTWARNLLMLDLTFGPSFKVKQWFTGFGELSFWWIQISIGSPMRWSSFYFEFELCDGFLATVWFKSLMPFLHEMFKDISVLMSLHLVVLLYWVFCSRGLTRMKNNQFGTFMVAV